MGMCKPPVRAECSHRYTCIFLLGNSQDMEQTMLVYRVEHQENHLGPYQNWVCDSRHYNNDNCPCPEDDGISKHDLAEARYGFKSKKDITRWFGREYLREFSYRKLNIYSFRVPDEHVSVGRRHLAFESYAATRVRRISLCELVR